MTTDPVSRVRYFPGQFLRTPDLAAEQAYHLAMRRRHNIAHHTFGIVSGLDVTLLDGDPVVEPGMAVDGYGRELVLVARTRLDVPAAFVARGTDRLDVWLAYQLVAAEPAPAGYASCTDQDTSYRRVEQPVLRYTVPDPDPDRRKPATVPPGDQDFPPERTAPDDPLADWPVFLATVTRQPDGTFTIDPDGRPYAGLVGECITAPSGRATVQVGAEHAADAFRFAVRVTGVPSPEVPRLAVLADGSVVAVGTTWLVGDAEVGGRLTIGGGTPIEVADIDKLPAAPWTLARVVEKVTSRSELRLEMGAGASDEVVVGTWTKPAAPPNADPQFVECLTIGSNRTVTVHGDLVVEGKLVDAAHRPLHLGPDAEAMVNAAFLSGVGGSSAVLGQFFAPEIDVVRARIGDALTVAAEAVAQDQGQLDQFAATLRAVDPDAAVRLRAALEPGP